MIAHGVAVTTSICGTVLVLGWGRKARAEALGSLAHHSRNAILDQQQPLRIELKRYSLTQIDPPAHFLQGTVPRRAHAPHPSNIGERIG